MHIFVDLDGTIAGANRPHEKRVINQHMKMGLSNDELDALTWAEFLNQPALVERFGDEKDPRRLRFLQTLSHNPNIFIEALPIAGSIAALRRLAQEGHVVRYATARGATLKEGASQKYQERIDTVNRVIAGVTCAWL